MTKRDGFENEILLTVPANMYAKPTPLTETFFLTDIGYFPKAADHFVERSAGCASHIMIICTSGEGWFDLGNGRKRVRQGEAFVLPAWRYHSYGSGESRWWEIYWLHINGSRAAGVLNHIAGENTGAAFPCLMRDDSRVVFSRLCSSLSEGCNPVKYELLCSRLWDLIGNLYSDSRSQSTSTSVVVRQCIRVMEERIGASLSLSDLGNQLSISPPYLCRLFKKETGHSPMEHYIHMKVRTACNLLDMTDRSIGEISRQIGIEDQYYFSRLFKKIMGLPPRSYRNRQK